MEEQKAIPPYMDYDVRTEENMEENEPVYYNNEINCYHVDFEDKVRIRLGGDYKIVVEDSVTYIVRKKPQCPKTYLECCKIISAKYGTHYFYTKKDKEEYPNEIKLLDQLDCLRKLLICRDAYWKIAGEQMGLGKPWKPEPRTHSKERYVVITDENDILFTTESWSIYRVLLEFPTAEMRDTFFENFKELIEQCKEFL